MELTLTLDGSGSGSGYGYGYGYGEGPGMMGGYGYNGPNSGAEHWVIRRWVCASNGTLQASWRLYKSNPNGSGVTGKLFHNGVEKDTATIAGTAAVGWTATDIGGVAYPGTAQFEGDSQTGDLHLCAAGTWPL